MAGRTHLNTPGARREKKIAAVPLLRDGCALYSPTRCCTRLLCQHNKPPSAPLSREANTKRPDDTILLWGRTSAPHSLSITHVLHLSSPGDVQQKTRCNPSDWKWASMCVIHGVDKNKPIEEIRFDGGRTRFP